MQNIVADMRKVLAKNPQVEQQKLHRRVFLENVNPENQALMVSQFVYVLYIWQKFSVFRFQILMFPVMSRKTWFFNFF